MLVYVVILDHLGGFKVKIDRCCRLKLLELNYTREIGVA